MVIIRTTCAISHEALSAAHRLIREQIPTGVVILPPYCELANEVPDDSDIKVITGEDAVEAWHNGRAAAKAELTEKVKTLKSLALGVARSTLDEVLRVIEKMEA